MYITILLTLFLAVADLARATVTMDFKAETGDLEHEENFRVTQKDMNTMLKDARRFVYKADKDSEAAGVLQAAFGPNWKEHHEQIKKDILKMSNAEMKIHDTNPYRTSPYDQLSSSRLAYTRTHRKLPSFREESVTRFLPDWHKGNRNTRAGAAIRELSQQVLGAGVDVKINKAGRKEFITSKEAEKRLMKGKSLRLDAGYVRKDTSDIMAYGKTGSRFKKYAKETVNPHRNADGWHVLTAMSTAAKNARRTRQMDAVARKARKKAKGQAKWEKAVKDGYVDPSKPRKGQKTGKSSKPVKGQGASSCKISAGKGLAKRCMPSEGKGASKPANKSQQPSISGSTTSAQSKTNDRVRKGKVSGQKSGAGSQSTRGKMIKASSSKTTSRAKSVKSKASATKGSFRVGKQGTAKGKKVTSKGKKATSTPRGKAKSTAKSTKGKMRTNRKDSTKNKAKTVSKNRVSKSAKPSSSNRKTKTAFKSGLTNKTKAKATIPKSTRKGQASRSKATSPATKGKTGVSKQRNNSKKGKLASNKSERASRTSTKKSTSRAGRANKAAPRVTSPRASKQVNKSTSSKKSNPSNARTAPKQTGQKKQSAKPAASRKQTARKQTAIKSTSRTSAKAIMPKKQGASKAAPKRSAKAVVPKKQASVQKSAPKAAPKRTAQVKAAANKPAQKAAPRKAIVKAAPKQAAAAPKPAAARKAAVPVKAAAKKTGKGRR